MNTPRPISFRKWSGKMYYDEGRLAAFFDCIEPGDIIMQFTGTKDKVGKDIYEGDVVRRMSRDYKGVDHECIELVGMGDWCNGVMEDNLTYTGPHVKGLRGLSSSWYGHLTHNLADGCEVIGNIYEQPELLKP